MKHYIYILFLIFFSQNLNALDLQKAKTYDKDKHNISNWMMSEKLDGIRAYWNGEKFLSKNGNTINAPKWFTKNFPKFHLDGELWTKRNDFENIQSIVLDKKPSKQWRDITYNVFEVPQKKGDFIQRLQKLETYLKKNPYTNIRIIEQIHCKNKKDLDNYLEKLVNLKAEGIIIKNPKLKYFTGRSSSILKVKKFHDMEGEIVGFNSNKNRLKSLKVKLKSNIIFNLGGGFTEKERVQNNFKIGDYVTFKYYNFTKYGKPKFASFLRIRKKE